MSDLKLHSFRCYSVTAEDEFSEVPAHKDSPYFLIFIGRGGNPPTCDVKLIRRPSWDNTVGAGTTVTPNVTVDSGLVSSTAVLVALMEEDASTDFNPATLTLLKNRMCALWRNVAAQPLNPPLINFLRKNFRDLILAFHSNDDLLGVNYLDVTGLPFTHPPMTFSGASGLYRVRFVEVP